MHYTLERLKCAEKGCDRSPEVFLQAWEGKVQYLPLPSDSYCHPHGLKKYGAMPKKEAKN